MRLTSEHRAHLKEQVSAAQKIRREKDRRIFRRLPDVKTSDIYGEPSEPKRREA